MADGVRKWIREGRKHGTEIIHKSKQKPSVHEEKPFSSARMQKMRVLAAAATAELSAAADNAAADTV